MKLLLIVFTFLCTLTLHAQVHAQTDSLYLTKNPPEVITPANADTVNSEEEVLAFSEVMPEFPGGKAAMEKYFQDSTRYPQMEKEQRKEGSVYVYFEVSKDGSIGNISVKKGVSGAPGLSKEAIRLIQAMPKWKPGQMNGKPVKVSMTVPVKFVVPK